ncbi:MAG: LON peptidase substrate-binding domain-containing protein [Pseudomonadota bacterium]
MEQNPFAPKFKDLPQSLPVFPLRSAFLLPTGQLPLNIFEPRYVQMVEDALSSNRMIGMIQPADDADTPKLSKTGCAGKITEFNEVGDGRFLITLSGVYRFDVIEELESTRLYRMVQPDWAPYENDASEDRCIDINRDKLKSLLKNYFKQQSMECDWSAFDGTPDGHLITCLSMVCPLESTEKQALLEAPCCKTRANLFMGMLEMAVKSDGASASSHRH